MFYGENFENYFLIKYTTFHFFPFMKKNRKVRCAFESLSYDMIFYLSPNIISLSLLWVFLLVFNSSDLILYSILFSVLTYFSSLVHTFQSTCFTFFKCKRLVI